MIREREELKKISEAYQEVITEISPEMKARRRDAIARSKVLIQKYLAQAKAAKDPETKKKYNEDAKKAQQRMKDMIAASKNEEVSEDSTLETKLTTKTHIEQQIRVIKRKMGETHKFVKGGASDKANKDMLAKKIKDLAEVNKEIAELKRNEEVK